MMNPIISRNIFQYLDLVDASMLFETSWVCRLVITEHVRYYQGEEKSEMEQMPMDTSTQWRDKFDTMLNHKEKWKRLFDYWTDADEIPSAEFLLEFQEFIDWGLFFECRKTFERMSTKFLMSLEFGPIEYLRQIYFQLILYPIENFPEKVMDPMFDTTTNDIGRREVLIKCRKILINHPLCNLDYLLYNYPPIANNKLAQSIRMRALEEMCVRG